ncbi:MAG TPA: ABC transporter permease [Methylomirabilota bacterium]|jgi:ribose transport system permease protein|nr:ABC transporter permease [Methylomirabilota bacterium]
MSATFVVAAEAPVPLGDRVLRARESGIFLFTLYLVLFLYWYTGETFWTSQNLLNVARNFSFVAMMAIGQALVIITGGIDLSVGSVLGLAGMIAGVLLGAGHGVGTAVTAALGTGIAAGAVNGFFVTRVGMPPFVPTLGMLSLARGLAFVLTQGRSISDFGPAADRFRSLGAGEVGEIPTPVLYMVVLAIGGWVFLARTHWGYRLYAIGGHEEAARLVGIPVGRMKFAVYVISGGLAALAGILTTSWLGVAQASAGTGQELDVIAAVVIGGTSLTGGQGTILGVVIAAALAGLIRNGLVQVQVSSYWTPVAVGTLLIAAVWLDQVRQRRLRLLHQ